MRTVYKVIGDFRLLTTASLSKAWYFCSPDVIKIETIYWSSPCIRNIYKMIDEFPLPATDLLSKGY